MGNSGAIFVRKALLVGRGWVGLSKTDPTWLGL